MLASTKIIKLIFNPMKNEITKNQIFDFLNALNEKQVEYLEKQIKNLRLKQYLRTLNK